MTSIKSLLLRFGSVSRFRSRLKRLLFPLFSFTMLYGVVLVGIIMTNKKRPIKYATKQSDWKHWAPENVFSDNPWLIEWYGRWQIISKYHPYTYKVVSVIRTIWLSLPPSTWFLIAFVVYFLIASRIWIKFGLTIWWRPLLVHLYRKIMWWPRFLRKLLRFERWVHIRRYPGKMWRRFHPLKFVLLAAFCADFYPIASDLLSPKPLGLLLGAFLSILLLEIRNSWEPKTYLQMGWQFFTVSQFFLFVGTFPFMLGIIRLYTQWDILPVNRFYAFEVAPACAFIIFGLVFNNISLFSPPGRGIMYDLDMWDWPQWDDVGIGGHYGHPTQRFYYSRGQESHSLHRRKEGLLFYFKLCFTGTFIPHMGAWPKGISPFYDSVPQRMAYGGGGDREAEQITRFREQTEDESVHLLGGLNRLWVSREIRYLQGKLARPPPEPSTRLYPPSWVPPIPGVSLPPGTPPPPFDVEKARQAIALKFEEDDDYRTWVNKRIGKLRRWTQVEPPNRRQFTEEFDIWRGGIRQASIDHLKYARGVFASRRMVRHKEIAAEQQEQFRLMEPVWDEVALERLHERLASIGSPLADPSTLPIPPVCYITRLVRPPTLPKLSMPLWDAILNQLPKMGFHFRILAVVFLFIFLLLLIAWPFMRGSGFVRIYRDNHYWRWRLGYRKSDLLFRLRRKLFQGLSSLPLSVGWIRRLLFRFEPFVEWFFHRRIQRHNAVEVYDMHLAFHLLMTVLTGGLLAGLTFSWVEGALSNPWIVWDFSNPWTTAKSIEALRKWEQWCFWPSPYHWYAGSSRFKRIFNDNWNYYYTLMRLPLKRGGRQWIKVYWLQAEPFKGLHWRGRNRKKEWFTGIRKRKYPKRVFAFRIFTKTYVRSDHFVKRLDFEKFIPHYLLIFLLYQTFGFDFGYSRFEEHAARYGKTNWFKLSPRKRRLKARAVQLDVEAHQDRIRKMNYVAAFTVVPLYIYYFLVYAPVFILSPQQCNLLESTLKILKFWRIFQLVLLTQLFLSLLGVHLNTMLFFIRR